MNFNFYHRIISIEIQYHKMLPMLHGSTYVCVWGLHEMMRVLALFAVTATEINHTVPIQYAPVVCLMIERWSHAHLNTKPIEWYPERCLHVPTAG